LHTVVRTPSIIAVAESTRRRREDEQQLVARVATGDREAALSDLYALYGRPLYGLGIHLLRDAGLAEDLIQETFIRLWRSARSYDPARGSVRTFVFTLARRAAVDLWRRRGAPVPALLDEPEQADAAGTVAYENLVLRLSVGEALEVLSPAQREVLDLQYQADLTQAQVAERLGIPLGTVKTRTMHALHRLADVLEERGLRA
jgi:RNA polymerase sigma-70 factor, ECF subfamily